MPSPLRRLSLALKIVQAYQPPKSPDNSTLAQFLVSSKEKYLNDIGTNPGKGGEWTVVMGNEAGDLDSLASSIAFAWIQSEVYKNPTIPLIRIERDDFNLRAENLYALELAGLKDPRRQLLSTTDMTEIKPFPSHKFALVDHNQLDSSFTFENPRAEVVSVLDHHEDEDLYHTAKPRTIAPAGSCASHVASLCPAEVPAELATLLLCAILTDTSGLKPGGKALQVDLYAAGSLASKSTFAASLPPKLRLALLDDQKVKGNALYKAQALKDLTNTLLTKKKDLAHLGGWDLLRRDYKEYTYTLSWAPDEPSIKAGLSTVPMGLESWAINGKLEDAAKGWMKHQDLTILGILTSFRDSKKLGKNGKGKHKREMAWIVNVDVGKQPSNSSAPRMFDHQALAERLWRGLEGSADIRAEKHKTFNIKEGTLPPGMSARVYNQGNLDATRKVIAPLLKGILEYDAVPSSTTIVKETK